MNPLKCEDIKLFVDRIDEIINSKEVEWQGRKITFGTEENLQNIDKFLNANAIYWKNPIVGDKLRELSARIKKEDNLPIAQQLADQYEEVGSSANLTPELTAMILEKVGEGRPGSEVKQDYHSTQLVSQQWRSLTLHAKIDYLNNHRSGWDEIFNSPEQVVQFAVESGSMLKTFNGLTFYDSETRSDPFKHEDYLKVFNACNKLTYVCLAGTGVTDETVRAACEKCKSLSILVLQDCNITALPEPLPAHLKELSLTNCPSIQTFPSKLPSKLETLKIFDSNANITRLPPRLKTLQVFYCDNRHLPETLPETLSTINLTYGVSPDLLKQLSDYQNKHPECQIKFWPARPPPENL